MKIFLTILTLFLFLFSGCNSNSNGTKESNLVVEIRDMPEDCNLTYEEFLRIGKVCDKPNNPPKIINYESNSTNEINMFENDFNVTKVVAYDLDDENLTFSLSGVDSDLFQIENGEISFKNSPNYESPLDDDKDNIYEIIISVSDFHDGNDSVNFNIKVNNVKETSIITYRPTATIAPTPIPTQPPVNNPPTITNYAEIANLTINENIANIASIKASDMDGESLTYSLFGSDMDKFNISQNGELNFIVAPNYELPLDSNGDNIYEVIVRVTDTSSFDEVLFMITINDVNENDIIAMEIDIEYTVYSGDKVEVLSDDAVINVIHTLDDNTKVITLISGSANLIRGDYLINE